MSSGALPQLNIVDFEPQIAWLIVVFSVFYYVVKNYVTPYFSVEVQDRQQFITKKYSEARQLQIKAERLSDDYNDKVQAIHTKANNLILDARQKFNHILETEKKNINNQTANRFNEHCQIIDTKIAQIDKDFIANIDVIKQKAQAKIFINHNLSTRAS